MKRETNIRSEQEAYVKAEAEKISDEMRDPKNWKRNETYFSMAVIGTMEERGEK